VVLRSGDFYGTERSSFPVGPRLLYVVLTRARFPRHAAWVGQRARAIVIRLSQS
jgi:hypothetical protein